MQWIDGHLDLAYLEILGRDLTVPCADPADGCVSLPALRAAGVEIAIATIFTEPVSDESHPGSSYAGIDDVDGAEAAGRRQLAIYQRLEAAGELRLVRRRDDLAAPADATPRVVLLMEGADPIRDPGHVASWFADGLRMVGLTWMLGTRYAGGNHRLGPLTSLGVELVAALDAFGIIHDASHLSDEAFDGLLAAAAGPVVASHSNCRAITGDNQRHLRDDQIRAIGARGGIVGLNLFTKFLTASGRATTEDCVMHVTRIAELMGHRRGVALGSDMDGGFGPDALPAGLDHPRKLDTLAAALADAGWTDDEVAGFAYGNWRGFLERALE